MKKKNLYQRLKRWIRFRDMYSYYQDMSEFMLYELTGINDWWYDNFYRRLKKLKYGK